LGRSYRETSIRSEEIVQRMCGMCYRQRKLVIDGKYNSEDGRIRVCIDGKTRMCVAKLKIQEFAEEKEDKG
jgi:hypothetical protein